MSGLLAGTPFEAMPGALAGAVVAGLLLPLLGMWVVLQRVVFLGVALSQVAAAGVALGLVLDLPPLALGLGLTVLFTVLITAGGRRRQATGDAALGAAFCAASALALVFISRSPAELDQVQHVLHGNLVYATMGDVGLVGGVLVLGLGLLALAFRPVLFTVFDRETAGAMGLSTRVWLLLLFVVLALGLSVSMRTTGSLLSFSLLVLPPLAALQLGLGLRATFAAASLLGLVGVLCGMALALRADLHVESALTLTTFALWPVARGFRVHPLLGAGLLAAAVAGGLSVSPPGGASEAHSHHGLADDHAEDHGPFHVDAWLAPKRSGTESVVVDWTVEIHCRDPAADLPVALWLIVTGEGLMHEHLLLADMDEVPAGDSRHTGSFTLPVDTLPHRLEGQLWTGSLLDGDARPLDPDEGLVIGADVH